MGGWGWGGGVYSAALLHPHISGTTFKIQTFIQARNRLVPPISPPSFFLPSSATHPLFRHSNLFLSPLRLLQLSLLSFPPPTSPCWIQTEKWGNESESGGERDRYIKHERRTEGETSKAKSSILNQSCGTKFCGTA